MGCLVLILITSYMHQVAALFIRGNLILLAKNAGGQGIDTSWRILTILETFSISILGSK
jgi:hypothetical protein